ncbi:MAG: hypothetical protein IKO14_10505 [Oscillibacter sp.]|nr:hypothetical protein [Oscillibacter sp.]
MSDCFVKFIVGITGLFIGSAELANGTRKRKTLSVALGLLTALGSVVLLCLSAYEWLTGEETELDEDEEEEEGDSAEEVPAADTNTEEAAPVEEEAE